MYRRDDEKLHCRDGEQAEHFSASQGAEQAGFSAQDGSRDLESGRYVLTGQSTYVSVVQYYVHPWVRITAK